MCLIAFLLGSSSTVIAQQTEFQAAIAKDSKAVFKDFQKWQNQYNEDKLTLDDFHDAVADGADFIFEGKFIKYVPIAQEDTLHQTGYIGVVEITHIYKGEETLKKGTVKVFVPCYNCSYYDFIRKEWHAQNESAHPTKELFSADPTHSMGIFFMTKSNRFNGGEHPDPYKVLKVVPDNKILLDFELIEYGVMPLIFIEPSQKDLEGSAGSMPFLYNKKTRRGAEKYSSVTDTRCWLSHRKGVTNPFCEEKPKIVAPIVSQLTERTNAANDPIYITASNRVSTNTTLKFDLTAAIRADNANPNPYFNRINVFLQYNTAAFGSNIASSVIVNKGSLFSQMNTASPSVPVYTIGGGATIMKVANYNSNTLRIEMIVYYNPSGGYNRTLLTTTPKKLLDITLPVIDCSQADGLQFVTITDAQAGLGSGTTAEFTVSANSAWTPVTPFTSINYAFYNRLASPEGICATPTGSFNYTVIRNPALPDNTLGALQIRAGVGDQLVITATNGTTFGTVPGTIFFNNADDPSSGNFAPALNGRTHKVSIPPQFVTWGNTQITLTLPYYFQVANLTAGIPLNDFKPGSGLFLVRLANSTVSTVSSTPLDICICSKRRCNSPRDSNGFSQPRLCKRNAFWNSRELLC
jgi:hypothetical protein